MYIEKDDNGLCQYKPKYHSSWKLLNMNVSTEQSILKKFGKKLKFSTIYWRSHFFPLENRKRVCLRYFEKITKCESGIDKCLYFYISTTITFTPYSDSHGNQQRQSVTPP